MPLPPAIEFLAAQRSETGAMLCHFGVSQVVTVIPANTTVRFTVTPRQGIYANYTFRSLLDAAMVPGSFRIQVFQYGARPYWATLYPSALGQFHDYFLRVTYAQPVVNYVTNLTGLNQQFISYDQSLVVASAADFKELERRLEIYLRQRPLEVT